jgi:aspartate dehydrogenase
VRIALLGAGTIARLVLGRVGKGELAGVQVAGVAARPGSARAEQLSREFGVPLLGGGEALLRLRPQAVLEAASHDAVHQHLVPFLQAGVSVIVLSAGALANDPLRRSAEQAANASGARLYVPSGGIGGLDALKAACVAGVEKVSIEVGKPPRAWKGIPFVEKLGIDLDELRAAKVLFDGNAREGVPHFPQNVNIAAVLSMAGIGFDRTRLKVVADPGLTRNTHRIEIDGASGRIAVTLENVPAPDNPKTAWLACYSALAALKEMASSVRYGT